MVFPINVCITSPTQNQVLDKCQPFTFSTVLNDPNNRVKKVKFNVNARGTTVNSISGQFTDRDGSDGWQVTTPNFNLVAFNESTAPT